VGRGYDCDQAREYQRPALEPETSGVRGKIAQRRAQSIRYQDGDPIEHLVLARRNMVELDLAGRKMPNDQNREYAAKKHNRRLDVTKARRTVQIIRRRGAYRRGSHNHGPVEERMVALGPYLGGQSDGKKPQKNQAADGITKIQRHRKRIAAGLSDRCGEDFDHPKHQRHLRDLAQNIRPRFCCFFTPQSCTSGIG